jgi:hypothetical protein
MIPAFIRSPDLNYGIDQTLAALDEPQQQVHKSWFEQQHFPNQRVNNDPKLKMLNLLYDQRGLLSHYYIKSPRKRNDFEQWQYHSLAFIAMSICHFCSIKGRLSPFRGK